MLGFAPLSATPISGSPYRLIAVPAALAAVATLTFGGQGTIGAIVRLSSTIAISFAGTPTLFVNQAISATIGMAFGGLPTLRVAGKPLVLRAIPQSYGLCAELQRYSLKALPQSLTVRGVK